MAKVSKILALLAIVAMLAALPMTALAQSEPPHVFIGTAVVNGLTAAPGTAITAWDGSKQIGMTQAKAGGKFSLQAGRSSGPITFKVDNVDAKESHPAWTLGEITPGLT